MRLALFDLDGTLIDGDSDVVWGELLAGLGLVDLARLRAFHEDYRAGVLDIDLFLEFQLEPLARHPLEKLLVWRAEYVARLLPRIRPGARALVARHAAEGHEIALITATNRFLVEPLLQDLGLANLIATEPEERDGRFTGRALAPPCYRQGKLACLNRWLAARHLARADLEESWFYSDSHNDLPLLSRVTHPVAVHPDPELAEHAARSGWPIVDLSRPPAE